MRLHSVCNAVTSTAKGICNMMSLASPEIKSVRNEKWRHVCTNIRYQTDQLWRLIFTYTRPFTQGRYTDVTTFVHVPTGLIITVDPSNDSPSYHSIHISAHLPLNKLVTPTTNSSIKPIISPFGDDKGLFGWAEVEITHAGRIELLQTRDDQIGLSIGYSSRSEGITGEPWDRTEILTILMVLLCPLDNWPHYFTPGHSCQDTACARQFDIASMKCPIPITWSVRDREMQENKFWRRSIQAIKMVTINGSMKPLPRSLVK